MSLDFEAIKELVKVSEKCDLSELIIEYEGVKVEIRRDSKKALSPVAVLPRSAPESLISLPVNGVIQKNSPEPAAQKEEEKNNVEDDSKLYKVQSPLVGIFYRAPWPGAKSFVEIGDKVTVGQTLCIVEAMKLMNEITSEETGTLVKILAKNEEVVQNGQVLFLIDPSK